MNGSTPSPTHFITIVATMCLSGCFTYELPYGWGPVIDVEKHEKFTRIGYAFPDQDADATAIIHRSEAYVQQLHDGYRMYYTQRNSENGRGTIHIAESRTGDPGTWVDDAEIELNGRFLDLDSTPRYDCGKPSPHAMETGDTRLFVRCSAKDTDDYDMYSARSRAEGKFELDDGVRYGEFEFSVGRAAFFVLADGVVAAMVDTQRHSTFEESGFSNNISLFASYDDGLTWNEDLSYYEEWHNPAILTTGDTRVSEQNHHFMVAHYNYELAAILHSWDGVRWPSTKVDNNGNVDNEDDWAPISLTEEDGTTRIAIDPEHDDLSMIAIDPEKSKWSVKDFLPGLRIYGDSNGRIAIYEYAGGASE